LWSSAHQGHENNVAENLVNGIDLAGPSETAQSNHVLNNGQDSLLVTGSGDKALTNIANGNGADGIFVNAFGEVQHTVTGNTANYNGGYGINAISPVFDGGTNKATGNAQQAQCRGLVCAVES
jgi:hypothetical protein